MNNPLTCFCAKLSINPFLPLLIAALIPSYFYFCDSSKLPLSPGNVKTDDTVDCDLGNMELSMEEDSVAVCDDKNSLNWFIYCSGRLLEASTRIRI